MVRRKTRNVKAQRTSTDRFMAARAYVYGGSSPARPSLAGTLTVLLALCIETCGKVREKEDVFSNGDSLHEPPSKRPFVPIGVPALHGFDKVARIPAREPLTLGLEVGQGEWED